MDEGTKLTGEALKEREESVRKAMAQNKRVPAVAKIGDTVKLHGRPMRIINITDHIVVLRYIGPNIKVGGDHGKRAQEPDRRGTGEEISREDGA